MGTIIIGVLLLAICVYAIYTTVHKARHGGGCCPERETPDQKVKVKDKNKSHYLYEVNLTIDGMTCGNCANRVANALNRLEGTWADEVSFGEGTAHVLTKSQPDTDSMRQAVANAGYTVLRVRKSRRE